MKTCKSCNIPVSEIEEYCDACEAMQANQTKCPSCEAAISSKQIACHRCNHQLKESNACDSSNPLQGLGAEPGCCVRMVVNKEDA